MQRVARRVAVCLMVLSIGSLGARPAFAVRCVASPDDACECCEGAGDTVSSLLSVAELPSCCRLVPGAPPSRVHVTSRLQHGDEPMAAPDAVTGVAPPTITTFPAPSRRDRPPPIPVYLQKRCLRL